MLLLLRSLAKLPLTTPAPELGVGGVRFSFSCVDCEVELVWVGLGCIVLGYVGGGCCTEERGGKEKLLSRALTSLKSFRAGGITLSRDLPIQLMAHEEEMYNNNANYSILITW